MELNKYTQAYKLLNSALQDKFKDYLFDMNIESTDGDDWLDNGIWNTFETILGLTLKDFLIEEHNKTFKVGEKPEETKEIIKQALRTIWYESK